MSLKTPQQARPIQSIATRANDVGDVRAIIAFALHNKSLAPDQFFRRTKIYFHAESLARHRMLEPAIIDSTDTITRAKNDIDELVCVIDFAEPVGEIEFRAEAPALTRVRVMYPSYPL